MAVKVKIKNFKSHLNSEIVLKPITLLFGPNNNGKSSLINALIFFRENMSLLFKTKFKFAEIDLSSYYEVVSFNDENKNIEFEITTVVDPEIFFESRKKFLEQKSKEIPDFYYNYNVLLDYEKEILENLRGMKVKAKYIFASNVKEKPESHKLKRIDLFINNKKVFHANFEILYFLETPEGKISWVLELEAPKGGTKLFLFNKEKELTSFLEALVNTFLDSIIAAKHKNVFIFNIKQAERKFFEFIELKNTTFGDFHAYRVDYAPEKLYNYENYVKYFKNHEMFDLINEFTRNKFDDFISVVFLFSHLITSQWGINLPKSNDFLGPIRKKPMHKYLLNGEVSYHNDFYYQNLIGKEFMDEIDEIIESTEDSLNFFFENLEIVPSKDNDIGSLYVRHNEVIYNLAEASSGLLQILPILIKQPLVIEQPELHLHPKLQTKFADLFVYWYKKEKKEVIIETHSEYILRRLQVLIAKGEISKDDVAVYYFDKKKGVTKIINMELVENGLFKHTWPDGFFDDKTNLTFDLLDALKNRN